jgi:hypothetical protein
MYLLAENFKELADSKITLFDIYEKKFSSSLKSFQSEKMKEILKKISTSQIVKDFVGKIEDQAIEEDLLNSGLVQLTSDGYQLIHETFAHHCISSCFLENLTKEKTVKNLVSKIFQQPGYQMIRFFMSEKFVGFNRDFGKSLEKHPENLLKIFQVFIEENLFHGFYFLYDSLFRQMTVKNLESMDFLNLNVGILKMVIDQIDDIKRFLDHLLGNFGSFFIRKLTIKFFEDNCLLHNGKNVKAFCDWMAQNIYPDFLETECDFSRISSDEISIDPKKIEVKMNGNLIT